MKLWSEFAAVSAEHECERTRAASLWGATRRYNRGPAPNSLALVQDFLNTRESAQRGPDLLGDGRSAQSWADTAMPYCRFWRRRSPNRFVPAGPASVDVISVSRGAEQVLDLRDGLPKTRKHR
jgi:hypothetical protein